MTQAASQLKDEANEGWFYVKVKDNLQHIIFYAGIIYIKVRNDQLSIWVEETDGINHYTITGCLTAFMKKLPHTYFVRANPAKCVNMHFVKYRNTKDKILLLKNNMEVGCSASGWRAARRKVNGRK